jgi:hypothetical protein
MGRWSMGHGFMLKVNQVFASVIWPSSRFILAAMGFLATNRDFQKLFDFFRVIR